MQQPNDGVHLAIYGVQHVAQTNSRRGSGTGRPLHYTRHYQPSLVIRLQFQAHTSLQRQRAGRRSSIHGGSSLSSGGGYAGRLLECRRRAGLRLHCKNRGEASGVGLRAGRGGAQGLEHDGERGPRGGVEGDHGFDLLRRRSEV